MLRSTVFVHAEPGRWVVFRGPAFTSEQRSIDWAGSVVREQMLRGLECVVVVWEGESRDVVYQLRSELVAA